MKKLLCILIAVQVFSVTTAQDSEALKKHYLKVYTQAMAYNDANTAIGALHNYIAIDGYNIIYKDTLAMLYFNVKSYYSSMLVSEEVYKASPGNVIAMARAAECYEEMGDPSSAIGLYEKVVPKTRNPYHIYKLALCQYQLKRPAESEASAKTVLADTTSKNIGVQFIMLDGSRQTIRVNAAAVNLLGVLKMDAKNYSAAKKEFEQALLIDPDFSGAKANLDFCEKNLKEGKKDPGKN
jgi:tetratricopeptide (TPR) repeat protein